MNYQKIIFDILGNKPVAFNPILAKATGSITAGLFLSQLLYWSGKEKNPEGWIFKTIKEMEEETALSRKEQDGAIKRLKMLKILEVSLKGVPAKRHFKINLEVLLKLISNLSKTGNQVCPKGTNWFAQNGQTNTYITTDITTDINIFPKGNIAKSETSENFENKTLEKKEATSKIDNGQPKKKSSYGDPEVNLIIETYKKKFGFTPTDRKVRFVAHVIRQNIKKFIKEIAPYRKYTFEEVVEKAFNWYASRDQFKGETLDVVRRKFKMLFEKTLKKAKEVQI